MKRTNWYHLFNGALIALVFFAALLYIVPTFPTLSHTFGVEAAYAFLPTGPEPEPDPQPEPEPEPEPLPDVAVQEAQEAANTIATISARTANAKAISEADLKAAQSATQEIIVLLQKEVLPSEKYAIIEDALSIFKYYDQMYVVTTKDTFVVWTNALAVAISRANGTLSNLEWVTEIAENTAKEVKPISKRLSASDARIDKTVSGLLNEALKVISTERIFSTMLVDDESVFQIDRIKANTRLTLVDRYLPRLEAALETFFDNKASYRLEKQLTFKIQIIEARKGIRATIQPDVYKALSSHQFEALALDVNGFSATLPIDLIDNNVPVEVALGLSETVYPTEGVQVPDLPLEGTQSILKYEKGTVVSIAVAANGIPQEKLSSPIRLGLPLDAYTFTGPQNTNQIAVYRYFEAYRGWRPVGGFYNPLTNTFFAWRDNLSEYTLLKSTKTFSDVNNTTAKTAIHKMLNKGVIPSSTTFNPSGKMNRQEFALWLVRAYGLENTKGKQVAFKDVPKTSPYYNAIVIVFHEGMMKERSATTFKPTDAITKAEMATALAVALEKYQAKTKDLQLAQQLLASTSGIPQGLEDEIALLKDLGIMATSDLNAWSGSITREQAAAFFSRAY